LEKKKKMKDKEGPIVATSVSEEKFSNKFDKEFSLVTLVSCVGSVGFVCEIDGSLTVEPHFI
jgi:hypothetical protein